MGAFASVSVEPLQGLTATAGVRVDHFGYSTRTLVSPRLSLMCRVSEVTTVTAAAGSYVQSLPHVILSQSLATSALREPDARHLVLGVGHLLSEDTRLTVEGYWKFSRRLPVDASQPRLFMLDDQAVIAIQNARLFQDLALEKERIVKTQEDAQKKLARDLHDGPTQSISAIAMRLNITQKILARSPAEAAAEIQKIENLARRTTKEIRHMLFTLRPLVLETEGLEAALHTIADKMRELYQQNIRVETDASVIKELDMPKQTVVFYLCEEAVNNARKHAQATEVNIRLNYAQNDASIAILEIADDGVGFDMKQVIGSYERRGSLGMINLRERSELISALLKIESSPGNGTRIRVFIPLNQDAIDRLHQLRDQAPGKSAQARPVPPGRGG